MIGNEEMTFQAKIELIDSLIQDLMGGNRVVKPMFPHVLVMVLKREQEIGGIVVPEQGQNKPNHEGIVLATWGEKIVERGTITKNGDRLTRCMVMRSGLKAGDHVLFHHYAGQPAHGYDQDRFRIVRERDWELSSGGGIFATVTYEGKETEPGAKLMEMFRDMTYGHENDPIDPGELSLLREQAEARFCIVDREQGGVTLSGR